MLRDNLEYTRRLVYEWAKRREDVELIVEGRV
jgi:hypothetical protein